MDMDMATDMATTTMMGTRAATTTGMTATRATATMRTTIMTRAITEATAMMMKVTTTATRATATVMTTMTTAMVMVMVTVTVMATDMDTAMDMVEATKPANIEKAPEDIRGPREATIIRAGSELVAPIDTEALSEIPTDTNLFRLVSLVQHNKRFIEPLELYVHLYLTWFALLSV